MENSKLYTCCFSGHRPKNLPWKYNEQGFRFLLFKLKLKNTIKKAIKQGYTNFITGMAQGFDILCAEIINKLKKSNNAIKLECAIPCKNQTEKWFTKTKTRYNKILNCADKITMISNVNYYNGCMQKRNKYMIDNSTLLIACFNGKNGGTKNTIEYAKSKNLKTIIIKP